MGRDFAEVGLELLVEVDAMKASRERGTADQPYSPFVGVDMFNCIFERGGCKQF